MSSKAPKLPARLRKWSVSPAANPRYKGATPADMVRALRGPVRRPDKARDGSTSRGP